eukprot:6671935-Prymnesium_polylepis.2
MAAFVHAVPSLDRLRVPLGRLLLLCMCAIVLAQTPHPTRATVQITEPVHMCSGPISVSRHPCAQGLLLQHRCRARSAQSCLLYTSDAADDM